jgi:hypothetical protein
LLRSALEGWQGRALRSGDELPCGEQSELNLLLKRRLGSLDDQAFRSVPWFFRPLPILESEVVDPMNSEVAISQSWIRPAKRLSLASFKSLQSRIEWISVVRPETSISTCAGELNSSGTVRGTLQLPQGAGADLLLMADGATGGYPQLAHLISADWALAGQLAPEVGYVLSRLNCKQPHQALKRTRTGDEADRRNTTSDGVGVSSRKVGAMSQSIDFEIETRVNCLVPQDCHTRCQCCRWSHRSISLAACMRAIQFEFASSRWPPQWSWMSPLRLHPSYPDREGFGRSDMDLPAAEIRDWVLYQIAAVAGLLKAEGIRLSHVKPHGALYNRTYRDRVVAEAIVEAMLAYDPSVF